MATMAFSSLSGTLLSAPKRKPIPKKTNRLMSSPSLTHTPPKKVLVPIAFGSEEMEAVIVVDVLRRAGADVLLASVEKELEVEGSLGTKIVADAHVSDCADEVFDLVALPGGMPGSVRLRDCEILRTITTNQAEEKRFYGAICAAPAVALKPWGLLKKKQITCHPAFMDKLPSFRTVKSNIQVSGELTTSRGPGTTFEFALSFVEQLFGGGVAAAVGGKLLMPNVGGPRKDEFNQVEWSFDHTPHGGVKGAERLHKSKILKRLLKEQKAAGKVYGGFGSSLAILQKQGLLMDKATKYHARVVSGIDDPESVEAGVVIDGKIITGRGSGSAIDLSLAIVNKLFGYGRARSVAEGLVFEYAKS